MRGWKRHLWAQSLELSRRQGNEVILVLLPLHRPLPVLPSLGRELEIGEPQQQHRRRLPKVPAVLVLGALEEGLVGVADGDHEVEVHRVLEHGEDEDEHEHLGPAEHGHADGDQHPQRRDQDVGLVGARVRREPMRRADRVVAFAQLAVLLPRGQADHECYGQRDEEDGEAVDCEVSRRQAGRRPIKHLLAEGETNQDRDARHAVGREGNC
jgi:hypothetical protein